MNRSIFGGNSNLPPGCRVSDIPGNRPEDQEWEIIEDGFWSNEKNCPDDIWKRFDDQKLSDDLMDIVSKAIEYGRDLGNKEQIEIQKENKYYTQMWVREYRNPKLIKFFKDQRQDSEMLFIRLEEIVNLINTGPLSTEIEDYRVQRAQDLLNEIRSKNHATIITDRTETNRCIQDPENNR